jgi:hypothetical protein
MFSPTATTDPRGKFDKDGKFLLAWGKRGNGPATSICHGITSDPMTRRVYVSDRGNKRMQVFDENGKFSIVAVLARFEHAVPDHPRRSFRDLGVQTRRPRW